MPLSRHALLFVAALALLGAGAPVARSPGPLYPGTASAWAGPLGAAMRSPGLIATLAPGVASLDLATPAGLRASAPLVAQLQGSLGYSPAAFAALPASDRAAAVQLAAEAARDDLNQKVYELADRARVLNSQASLDKDGRAELYAVVAHLTELRDHYRGFLDDRALADTEGAYSLAAGKAWAVRRALLGETVGQALDEAAPAPAASPAALGALRKPSAKAVKLRARMAATKTGWGQNDFRALYEGYGFIERQGSDHRFYSHPVFPQLHDSVGRHNELATGYAHEALKILAEYDRLTAPQAPGARLAAANDGPPAAFSLELISVLLSPPSSKAALAASAAPEALLERPAAAPRAPRAARLLPATPLAERASRERAAPPAPVSATVETPAVPVAAAPAAGDRESLTMPGGGRLEVKRLETHRDRLFGNMFMETLPAEGQLFIGGDEGEGYMWQKNTLVPWDYVVTDSKGAVTQVIAEAAPSPPRTPWGEVGIFKYTGTHVLTLPAGDAARRGLAPGVVIPELAGRVETRSVQALAALALSGEAGLLSVLEHFENRPDDYSALEDALDLIKRDGGREAVARFYDAALARPGFRYGMHEGLLSHYDLGLWAARTKPFDVYRAAARSLLFWPKTFVHELGHHLAFRLFGVKPRKFRVFFTGGGFVQPPEDAKLRPWQEAFVSAAGPLLQFAAGLALLSLGMPALEAAALPAPHHALSVGECAALLLGWLYASTAVPSGAMDIPNGAWQLGHKRFSAEMNWRRETRMFGGTYFILYQMLFLETFFNWATTARNNAEYLLGEESAERR